MNNNCQWSDHGIHENHNILPFMDLPCSVLAAFATCQILCWWSRSLLEACFMERKWHISEWLLFYVFKSWRVPPVTPCIRFLSFWYGAIGVVFLFNFFVSMMLLLIVVSTTTDQILEVFCLHIHLARFLTSSIELKLSHSMSSLNGPSSIPILKAIVAMFQLILVMDTCSYSTLSR